MSREATWRFEWKALERQRLDRAAAEVSQRLGAVLIVDDADLEDEDEDEDDDDEGRDEEELEELTYAFALPSGKTGQLTLYAGEEDVGAWLNVHSADADNELCWDELCAFADRLASRLGGARED
jgi:hypothetical protein